MLHIVNCMAIGAFVGMAGLIPFSIFGDHPTRKTAAFLIIVAVYALIGLLTGIITLN